MILRSAYELALERMVVSRIKPVFEDDQPSETVIDKDFFVPLDDLKYTDKKDKAEEGDIKMVSYPKTVMSDTKNLLQVHWSGNFLDYGGYARMNRAFAFGLADRNVLVRAEIADYIEHVNESTKALLENMSRNRVAPNAPKVFGATIPIDPNHGGRKIYYTMMETSERVHKDYAEKMNLASEVWVPTNYGKLIMENSGVATPIYVMPLGVDTERYAPGLEPLEIINKLKGFVFVSVFRWGFRKGFDILLQSYLEEFSAKDDVSLLIVSRPVDCMEETGNEKMIGQFNVIKDSVKKDHHAHVALYTKPIPERDMPRVYNTGDAFALISRGEGMGLPYCFREGTYILTNDGMKKIEHITKKDVVISGHNRNKKVTDIHVNKYVGEFFKIKTRFMIDRLSVTSNHSFLAYKPHRGRSNKIMNKDVSRWEPSWIRASNLDKDSYLVYPIKKRWPHKNQFLDLEESCRSDHVVVDADIMYSKYSNRISLSNKFGNQEIANEAGVSKRQVEHYKQDGKINKIDGKKIQDVMRRNGISKEKICVPRRVEIDERVAKLLGYYLAEGSISGHNVEFDFHSKENQYHSEVASTLKDIFGLSCSIKKRGNRCRIVVSSSIIANMFEFYCGRGSHNKYIHPKILRSSRESIMSLLNGYINGDGHSSVKGNSISISTVSEALARQYQRLMLDMGEYCSLVKCKSRGGHSGGFVCNISGFRGNAEKWIEIDKRIKKSKIFSRTYSNDSYIFLRITDLERYYDNCNVYNLDVLDDHSYIAGVVVAHNCEAGSCEIPVIASSCSGHSDFMTDDTAFVVKPDGFVVSKRTDPPFRNMSKICRFYEDQLFPDFGRPAIDKVKADMRFVFENRDSEDVISKIKKFKSLIEKKYTWNIAVDRVYNRIEKIAKEESK